AVHSAAAKLSLAADSAERTGEDGGREFFESIDAVRRNAYRILRAADESALYAKLISDPLSENRRLCDLNELLKRICAGVSSAVLGAKIELETPDEPLIIPLDLQLAERSILAVICNSLTYTRDGNRIELRLSLVGSRAVISIRDRGQGIKPELISHVCEPYFSREPANDSDYSPSLG
ncbi:MAG: hypothetical protein Q4B42_07620, partial [Oscillospiraceae bacterium]|nr:hypothetical protein [Oscillospiraceae bacterium]